MFTSDPPSLSVATVMPHTCRRVVSTKKPDSSASGSDKASGRPNACTYHFLYGGSLQLFSLSRQLPRCKSRLAGNTTGTRKRNEKLAMIAFPTIGPDAVGPPTIARAIRPSKLLHYHVSTKIQRMTSRWHRLSPDIRTFPDLCVQVWKAVWNMWRRAFTKSSIQEY